MSWVERVLSQPADAADGAGSEVESEDDKDKQGDNLKGKTCNHDVVPDSWIFILVSLRAGNTTAKGLEDQRSNVAGDEDARVRQRLNARVLSAECADNAGQAEVDTSCKEGRSNREADDLDQEGVRKLSVRAHESDIYHIPL